MFKKLLAALLAFLAMSVFAAVDVNKATQAELDGVKGIGPAIASHIVAARAKGPFKDWQDLISRTSGIGEKSASKLSAAGLTVNGQTFNGAPAAVAAKKGKAEPASPAVQATAPAAQAKPETAEEAKAKQAAAKKEKAAAEPKASAAAHAAAKKEKHAKKADKAASGA